MQMRGKDEVQTAPTQRINLYGKPEVREFQDSCSGEKGESRGEVGRGVETMAGSGMGLTGSRKAKDTT